MQGCFCSFYPGDGVVAPIVFQLIITIWLIRVIETDTLCLSQDDN